MKNVLAMVAVAGLCAAASADFNTGIQAGPFDSNGSAGAAVNGVFTFTYTGSSGATYNSIRIRGTATDNGAGSYLSELRWRFVGASNIDSGAVASGTTCPASIDAAAANTTSTALATRTTVTRVVLKTGIGRSASAARATGTSDNPGSTSAAPAPIASRASGVMVGLPILTRPSRAAPAAVAAIAVAPGRTGARSGSADPPGSAGTTRAPGSAATTAQRWVAGNPPGARGPGRRNLGDRFMSRMDE